jgi:hypothetical protein
MGFFKNLNDLNKISHDLQKNNDPGQRMKDSMARMGAVQEMLAQQTQAANIASTGLPATASVVAAQATGQQINFQPTMQLELTVFPAAGLPYPVTLTQVVEQLYLAKATAGNQLKVKVDQADPQLVWIDWAAS